MKTTDATPVSNSATTMIAAAHSELEAINKAWLEELHMKRTMLMNYVRYQMVEGKDYGNTIPGTDGKTLLKPGAEKLCTLLNLRPQLTIIDSMMDWDKGIFFFRAKCTIFIKRGEPIVEVEASANTMEKRFKRKLVIPGWEATAEQKAIGKKETRESKKGKKYTVIVIVDDNAPFDNVDNCMAIAMKRSFVRGVTIAANASEIFKSLEDDDSMNPVDDGASRAELMAENDLLLEQKGWLPQDGGKYIQSKYKKRARKSLTLPQLRGFNAHLESLPDAPDAQPSHPTQETSQDKGNDNVSASDSALTANSQEADS